MQINVKSTEDEYMLEEFNINFLTRLILPEHDEYALLVLESDDGSEPDFSGPDTEHYQEVWG